MNIKKSRRRYPNFRLHPIIIFIVLLIIITTIVFAVDGNYSVKNIFKKIPISLINKDHISCEKWAMTIIPETAMMQFSGDTGYIRKIVWTDNSTFTQESMNTFYCNPGKNAGENVNYCYQRGRIPNIYSEFFYVDYKKQVIDKKGEILGYNFFDIEMVFDPNIKTPINNYYTSDFFHRHLDNMYNVKIVDVKFHKCNHVN